MDDFLEFLADRKYSFYRYLYKNNKQAYTKQECIDRVSNLERYEELVNLINMLPVHEKRTVDKLFEEQKGLL